MKSRQQLIDAIQATQKAIDALQYLQSVLIVELRKKRPQEVRRVA